MLIEAFPLSNDTRLNEITQASYYSAAMIDCYTNGIIDHVQYKSKSIGCSWKNWPSQGWDTGLNCIKYVTPLGLPNGRYIVDLSSTSAVITFLKGLETSPFANIQK